MQKENSGLEYSLKSEQNLLDGMHILRVRILVSHKDAEIFLCKLPHLALITLIFHVKKLMYQGSHCPAFEIKTNLLFLVILQLLPKKASPFWKNENYAAITVASSSKGPSIFVFKREHSNLNIIDSHFLNFFPFH
jgi:hypothetical protein